MSRTLPARGRRLSAGVALATVAALLPLSGAFAPAVAAPQGPDEITISVLSGRADTVTGEEALVRVTLPADTDPGRVEVDVDGRDVTADFARRADGRLDGLVTGLRRGQNVVTAKDDGTPRARLVLTAHPVAGPVFSGPQLQPWICNTTNPPDAVGSTQPNILGPTTTDEQCSTPTVTRLYYKPIAGNQFLEYDPATTPAAAVATTTTQTGVTMPFVVRLEMGVANRGIYAIAVLFDEDATWTALQPQPQWNGKLLTVFGGGNSPKHTQGLPQTVLDENALSQGWVVAGSGLMVLGHQDNPIVSSEALMMLEERVVEGYGPIRYTVSAGCSGGGILQDYAATQYPGLLDGLLVNCNYSDIWTTAPEVIDCYLLDKYASRQPQDAAAVNEVTGHVDDSVCQAWDALFAPVLNPTRASGCALPQEQVYHPETNPDGVRCTPQDYAKNIWGQRSPRDWTPPEKAIGRGFAPLAQSNVGVLYGLASLDAGEITAAEFVAINSGVGGLDIDRNILPERTDVDDQTLATAYRTGHVSDGRQLARVPIIDLRAGLNEGEIHTPVHSQILRARLDAHTGSHGNHVIWTFQGSAPILGVTPPWEIADLALATMDTWLATLEAEGGLGVPEAVAKTRPTTAVDTCFVGSPSTGVTGPSVPAPTQVPVTDPAQCSTLYPVYSAPRLEAGMPLDATVIACQLQPLADQEFPVSFTDAQWAALEATFPTGVCDYDRPGRGDQPSVPWQSYAAGPGGQALPPPPVSTAFAARAATGPPVGTTGPGAGSKRDGAALAATGATSALPAAAAVLLLAALLGLFRLRRTTWTS